jgi:hypothetical protein
MIIEKRWIAALRAALIATLGTASAMSPVAPAGAQAPPVRCGPDSIVPIAPPRTPLPSELATASVTRFSFIAYGDTRGRHDGEQLQAEHQLVIESMLATIQARASGADPIRFVVQSGDAVRSGPVAAQWRVSYIPLIERLTRDAGVPYFLAVGNHDVTSTEDVHDPARAAGLCHYFSANARLIPAEGSPHRIAGYPDYGFGYGNTFFIAFDSNVANDDAQLAWVRRELETLDRRRYPNVVVFIHHPPFSSGPHGGATLERQAAALRTRYMPLFRRHHVQLLLTGHEHLFEHWVERYEDASGPHRLDEIVSGGGGAPLYTYRGEPDLRAYLEAGAAEHVAVEHLVRPSPEPGANPFHYVIVHVDGDRFGVEVVGVDWGRGFAPYRSATATLTDSARSVVPR